MRSWPSGLFQSFIDGHRAELPISQQHTDLGAAVLTAFVSLCVKGGVICVLRTVCVGIVAVFAFRLL